jgi:acyl carrier protein
MSNDKTIEKKLLELAAIRFEADTSGMSPEDDFFEKLGIDSFQAMELLTDIESEFDIEIPDYELQGVNTFAGLAEVIGRRL